ncbi:uncharacterized protein LOC126675189 isoform X1 [Mercurialis annua]|uniref:uncharacterized protein LOC126675189 isoform X1 n=1 Tax=Mercurialis annua TaxID=3986 RepID=UPI00215EE5F6|nr:uncharacterized protein LOC126675189 isoform X1 [Mercurialis annua]
MAMPCCTTTTSTTIFCIPKQLSTSIKTDNFNISWSNTTTHSRKLSKNNSSFVAMSLNSASRTTSSSMEYEKLKRVWIWTENKQVMTAAVERGWNTFLFCPQFHELAHQWSLTAMINTLFVDDGEILDDENKRVAAMLEISTPEELQQFQPENVQAETVVVNLLDWQIIPAENMVAAFQNSQKRVLAVSRTPSEAKVFLEALEHGLGGIVLRVDDVEAVFELKDYFDRRNAASNLLTLTKATITKIEPAGMGDRVCVDLCSLMKPGEGLLVGSFARGLFLVHSECLESNYIASRPFRVNAGPVHAYVSVPGGKTSYLSELKAGREVIVVDQKGQLRTAIVGRVKIESRPLVLVNAKIESDDQTIYSIFLQNAETVALILPCQGNEVRKMAIPVTALKVGDEVLVHLQGAARHTGIEIQEFIVEN